MLDGASDDQIAGRLLKVDYQKFIVMRGVEHTLSLFSMMYLKYQLFVK